MPVDIDTMRSEISIQSAAEGSSAAAPPPGVDTEQLREIIREVVMEIVADDVYSLFRLRGM